MKPYYEKDGIVIYHGDCREVLPLVDADVCITDPPYGIGHSSNGQRFRAATEIAGDKDTSLAEQVVGAMGIPVAAFFSPYKPFGQWRSVLVWSKGAHVGIGGDRATCWKRDFELIGVRDNAPLNGKRDSAVLNYPALLPPPTGHFCEKPVSLMRYLVSKLSQPGDTVVDPFAGTGPTLDAARMEGRKAIGIEISEAYCEIAANRLAQGVLF